MLQLASGQEHPILDAEEEVHPSQQSTVAGPPLCLPAAEVDETLADLMAIGEGGCNASRTSILDTFLDPVDPAQDADGHSGPCAPGMETIEL